MEAFLQANWIFLIPFFLAFLYVIVQLVLGIGLDDLLEVDVDTDLDVDVDVEVEVEVETDVEVEAEADAADGSHIQWLDILGLGKAPLIFSLAFLGIVWGSVGMMFNRIEPVPTWLAALAAVPAAVVAGRFLLPLVGRLMPSVETYAVQPSDLVGRTAKVTSPRVTGQFGEARLKDHRGQLRWLRCFSDTEIQRDTLILLTRYDPQRKAYYAAPLTEAEQSQLLGEQLPDPQVLTERQRRKDHE